VDGVESTSPAGGTNGVVARTGEDVALLLDALAGEITEGQLYADLGSRIDLIDGSAAGSVNARLAAEEISRANAIAAASLAQANALADEATARAAAIALETSNRATALAAESAARASAIALVDDAIRADLATADAAVVSSLTSAFQSADAATLTSAQSYTYSKAQTDSAISAAGTLLTSDFQSGDAATLASANNFTYSRSAIDSADAATLSTLRTEFAAADTATLASAQNYTYAKATIDSAIATSATTLRTQLTGGSTATDINTLSSGLLYQERISRAAQDSALSQQITLLSAGAGEQFDYSNIWYFDSGVEGWTADTTTSTTVSSVAGWLRMVATTGTLTGRKFQSPAALGIDGAKYPQVRLRVRKVGSPVWVGRLYFVTTVDAVWNTTKSLLVAAPTYDTNNIGLLTFNMPAGWTGTTIAQMRFEASVDITTANYFEIDWAAVGRPSPGASSAQLAAEELARATADSAEATARLALEALVNDKASASAVSDLSTRVTSVEGVNTSQGSSITSLNNSVTTLTTGLAAKADASALTALTTRVTNAEGVNTSQGSSITTLNNNVSTLTTGLATKADATALTALTTRVTSAEGVNTTQSGNITTLTNSLTTLTGTVDTKASASALNDLTTRVTAAEGVNTSQASSITSLNSSLTTTNTNVAAAGTKANATENSQSFVARPVGGSYSGTINTTGAIKIALPVLFTNTMIQFSVDVYDYATNKSFTAVIGGYNYATSRSWLQTSASIIGGEAANYTIRFGHDGVKSCVWIGEITTVWQYPKVVVKNLQVGHFNFTLGMWEAGWAVTVVPAFDTVLLTDSDNLVQASDVLKVGGTLAATVRDNASTALTNAATANALLADISSDSKITPVEKQAVRTEWDVIATEKAGNNAQATTFAVTTENTAYNTAFQTLATYLNAGTTWTSGTPSWISDANLSVTTAIVGATFRTNFASYYAARTALLNAIALKAKTLADAAQTTANSLAVTKADASALTTTNTNVTNLGGVVTAQGTRVTNLEASVNSGTTGLATKASIGYVDTAKADAISASATSIQQLSSRVDNTSQGVFFESFETADSLGKWINYQGSGERSSAAVSDAAQGGSVLRVGNNSGNDEAWLTHQDNIPFDPTRLYKTTCRVRRINGTGMVYIGFAGVLADGVTFCSLTGASPAIANHHYHTARDASPGTTWTTYTGYTKGFGATVGTDLVATAAAPGVMHPNVRFVRPFLLVNYSGAAGITEVDSFTVEDVTDVQAATAAVQTEATTRATQTGDLFAQYTVKTDVGGLVSGYGSVS